MSWNPYSAGSLYFISTLFRACMCDLDLTFVLAVVSLTYEVLSRCISATIMCRQLILGRDIG